MNTNTHNLQFFNTLSGALDIELSEPTHNLGSMLVQVAPADAQLASVELDLRKCDDNLPCGYADLTAEELALVVFEEPSVVLKGAAGIPVTHQAPDGKRFTVGDLIEAVIATEVQTRGQSEWFGGIDTHHVFFEGISLAPDKSCWLIYWGS